MVQQSLFQLCHVAGGRERQAGRISYSTKTTTLRKLSCSSLCLADQFFIYAQRRTASGNSHHKVSPISCFFANLVCYLLSDGKRTFFGRFVDVCRGSFPDGSKLNAQKHFPDDNTAAAVASEVICELRSVFMFNSRFSIFILHNSESQIY